RNSPLYLFAFLSILTGLILAGYGVYQLLYTSLEQEQSLGKARKLVETGPEASQIEAVHKSEETQWAKPEKGEIIGILSIPAIQSELAIIEGTDEDELEKGVGHYRGTAFPAEKGQVVLSGHRDTVFRRMGEVEIGDLFIIRMEYGSFTYAMADARIVEAGDLTVIDTVPASEEVLTLITCYPFSYVGNAPQRYIITAVPADGK
ncbi:MAG TPA: class D sortase, partial [Bacillaceae bacterium]